MTHKREQPVFSIADAVMVAGAVTAIAGIAATVIHITAIAA